MNFLCERRLEWRVKLVCWMANTDRGEETSHAGFRTERDGMKMFIPVRIHDGAGAMASA